MFNRPCIICDLFICYHYFCFFPNGQSVSDNWRKIQFVCETFFPYLESVAQYQSHTLEQKVPTDNITRGLCFSSLSLLHYAFDFILFYFLVGHGILCDPFGCLHATSLSNRDFLEYVILNQKQMRENMTIGEIT